MLDGSVPDTSPTSPRSTVSPSTVTGGFLSHTVQKYPGMPTASRSHSSRQDTTSELILLRTISATSSESASVTLTPATFLGVIPLRSISSEISGPPPCTSTTPHPAFLIRATSLDRASMPSRPRMALPPNFSRYMRICISSRTPR